MTSGSGGSSGTRAYVVLEDVARDVRLVDARVLVALEVLQRVVGDTLVLRSFCAGLAIAGTHKFSFGVGGAPLLGGMLGCVAGAGSDMRGVE